MAKKQKESTEVSIPIMLELCKRGCKVHREQSALLYTPRGDRMRVGFPGKADLQGHRPSDGKCFYIESKEPENGKERKAQEKFINAMKASGALAGFARSVEDALKIVFPENY